MALRVLWEVAENIENIDFYSIICNEAIDIKNVFEVVVCLTWVDDELPGHDKFVGLKNMPNTGKHVDSILQEMKDVLLRMHLKLNKCRGQCYDGCSTIPGSKSRVTLEIKNKKERALYTHFYANLVNLVVGDRKKVCRFLRTLLIIDIYLRIDKACVTFLKLFTNFPYSRIRTR